AGAVSAEGGAAVVSRTGAGTAGLGSPTAACGAGGGATGGRSGALRTRSSRVSPCARSRAATDRDSSASPLTSEGLRCCATERASSASWVTGASGADSSVSSSSNGFASSVAGVEPRGVVATRSSTACASASQSRSGTAAPPSSASACSNSVGSSSSITLSVAARRQIFAQLASGLVHAPGDGALAAAEHLARVEVRQAVHGHQNERRAQDLAQRVDALDDRERHLPVLGGDRRAANRAPPLDEQRLDARVVRRARALARLPS